MTLGKGEGKVKLHTMNLLAAGSPLTDIGCLSIQLKIQWSIRNAFAFLGCSLPFLPGGKRIHGILVNSAMHVAHGTGRYSWKISSTVVLGPSAH